MMGIYQISKSITDIHARMLAKPAFVVTPIKKNGNSWDRGGGKTDKLVALYLHILGDIRNSRYSRYRVLYILLLNIRKKTWFIYLIFSKKNLKKVLRFYN